MIIIDLKNLEEQSKSKGDTSEILVGGHLKVALPLRDMVLFYGQNISVDIKLLLASTIGHQINFYKKNWPLN